MSALTLNSQQAYTDVIDSLTKDNKDVNPFAISQIEKISINVGVGKYDTKQQVEIADYLNKLTGNEPKKVPSKVSIAGFKLRKGQIVGLVSTLRGKKMRDFLTHLIYLALPRTRDFRGLKVDAFDKNEKVYSLGIENASIFPVIGFDTSVNFGMQINIVFKKASPMNRELLTKLNFPFKKTN
jgi:large subunit ribosomal protein L5